MKLNFNFNESRKNLAEELIKIHKEDGPKNANKKLNEAKLSDEYKEAKKQKILFDKSNIKEFSNISDDIPLVNEMVKDYGFEARDISAEIPIELKVFFDKLKLGYYDEAIYQGDNDIYFWERVRPQRGTPYDEYTPVQKLRKEYEDFSTSYNTKELVNLFNKISNGKFSNPKNLIHNFYGYNFDEGYLVDDLKSRSQSLNIDPILLKPINFASMKGDKNGTNEHKMFFSSSGLNSMMYVSPLKETAIFTNKNPNFEKFLILELILSAKAIGIDIPIDYTSNTDEAFKHKDLIVKLFLENEKVKSKLKSFNEQRYYDVICSNKDIEQKMIDEDWFPDSYFYEGNGDTSNILSLLKLLDKELFIMITEGAYFQHAEEAMKKLAEYLGKEDIKFIDLADTVIDLSTSKIYEYKG